jgi:hypothetical protein
MNKHLQNCNIYGALSLLHAFYIWRNLESEIFIFFFLFFVFAEINGPSNVLFVGVPSVTSMQMKCEALLLAWLLERCR